jgi:hypothetical protein
MQGTLNIMSSSIDYIEVGELTGLSRSAVPGNCEG